MRLLLDATAGARQDPSGIGRYIHELLRALVPLRPSLEVTVGVRWSKWKGRRFLPSPLQSNRPLKYRLLEDRWDRWFLRGYDVFHGLDARLTPARSVARVVTLHDVFSWERDDLASERFRQKKQRRYRSIAEHADRIVCVSEVTRRRFLDAFPHVESRTRVVPHGVSDRFRPADQAQLQRIRSQYELKRPFLLFVGLLSTRKNLERLLQAFDRVAKERTDLELVLVGKPSHGFEKIQRQLGETRARSRIRSLGFLPQEHLPTMYAAAELFVFPSLAEGFGLPVLEAMSCGTPVVSNDLEVLREVGGPELRTADASDGEALAQAILAALNEDRAQRRHALIEHASAYRWQRTAQETLAIYQELGPSS